MLRFGLLICVCLFFLGCALLFAFLVCGLTLFFFHLFCFFTRFSDFRSLMGLDHHKSTVDTL